MDEQQQGKAMQTFYSKCGENGLKVTPQRVFIYQELLKAMDHPSIEQIYQRVKKSFTNISFDTVYRTVLSLVELGLLDIIEGRHGSRRFDANIVHHHHFSCLKCHKIMDFESDYYDKISVPAELKKKFKVIYQRIMLEGICETCQKEENQSLKKT